MVRYVYSPIIIIATTISILLMGLLLYDTVYPADPILGKKPSYGLLVSVSSVPNKKAIGTRIWVPGLDDGFVPQGMTFAEGQILVSLYQSTDVNKSSGPSRVYRVDRKTGNVTGQFDLPPDVGHADGLAYAGGNVLYVADTRSKQIYKLDLEKAIREGNCNESVLSKIIVHKSMGPAFLTYDGGYLWSGQYTKSKPDIPKIYKIDPHGVFKEWPAITKVSPDAALFSFEIDAESQGATFDKDGYLWLSQSGSKMGKVQKVDPSNGKVLKEYELMAGVEDLAIAPDGKLWSVSEAGTKRWLKWQTFYPLIFEIDITKLK
jgi:DNA-binding beta-propeller fold protein YncE